MDKEEQAGGKIVVLTKDYRVYYYYQPRTEMYYIGKTKDSLNKRAINKHTGIGYQKSKKFYPAIQEFGGLETFERGILKDNLTREEAAYWEKYYISYFNSIEHGYNLQSGGDGCPGVSISDEMKKHLSEVLIDKAKAGEVKACPVRQYDLDGNLLAEYFSLSEAGKQTGLPTGNILQCCQGICKTIAGKYQFRFASEGPDNLTSIECKTLLRPVAQYDLDGNLLGVYPSLSEAARQTGCLVSGIFGCIKGERKIHKNFRWEAV